MEKFLRVFIALCLPALLLSSQARSAEEINEVKLPAEKNYRSTNASIPNKESINALNPFSISGKTVLREPATGSPRRVLGAPEKISGFGKLTDGNIDEAARAFLKSKESELGIKGIDLKLRRKTHVNGRWYVTYAQSYKGVEVLLTEVELRIFDNGNVAMYGADVIPNISLSVQPELSYNNVINKVDKEFEGKGKVDKLQSSEKLYVLPIKSSTGVVCRLVWRTELVGSDKKRFINYIDANEGLPVWRFEKTKFASTQVSVKGMVKPNMATDEPKEVCFPDLKFTANGVEYFTDSKGESTIEAQSDMPVVVGLNGKYVRVSSTDGQYETRMQINETLHPGQPLNIKINDDNSSAYERSVYRYVNDIHSDLKSIDPDIAVMDFPMTVIISTHPESANAGSAGDTIYFIGAGLDGTNMPETPSILYHEYTHSINALLYKELGSLDGMVNGSANEGTADLYACLIQQQPKVGLGTFNDDASKYIRCIDNDNIYPDSLSSDTHFNGEILSGAFWDLAKATSTDFVKRLSHKIKYAMPDDPDIGKCYSEWFLETLIADDDDGDLTNGTPHYDAIINSFNKHHIGTDLLMTQSFAHTPVADTEDTLHTIPVAFNVLSSQLPGCGLKDVSVMYSTDNGVTYKSTEAFATDGGGYLAQIPAQSPGTIIQYYVHGVESKTNTSINFFKTAFNKENLTFLVGFKTYSTDNCENPDGWQLVTEDNNYGAEWECADPGLVDLTSLTHGMIGLLQPENDHSEQGNKCFVTDATAIEISNPYSFFSHAVLGTTSIISPEISLKDITFPIIKFWRYTYFQVYTDPEETPSLKLFYSVNNGSTWKEIETFTESTEDWEPYLVNVNKIAPDASSIKLKFTADNQGQYFIYGIGNICECLVDDISVLGSVNGIKSAGDINSQNILSVFPNPVADAIRIQTEEPGAVVITNALGVPQYESQVGAGITSVNLREFPAGIYFVKLSNSNGINLCKFVKK